MWYEVKNEDKVHRVFVYYMEQAKYTPDNRFLLTDSYADGLQPTSVGACEIDSRLVMYCAEGFDPEEFNRELKRVNPSGHWVNRDAFADMMRKQWINVPKDDLKPIVHTNEEALYALRSFEEEE